MSSSSSYLGKSKLMENGGGAITLRKNSVQWTVSEVYSYFDQNDLRLLYVHGLHIAWESTQSAGTNAI